MPFIGWHLNRSGQIPVDTVSSNSTVSSLGAGGSRPPLRHAVVCLS